LKELSLHMTAWELFRHWYQVASGDALELGAATADQEVLNNIAEMVSLAKQHNVSGWQAQGSARGRLLLQGSEGPKVLGRYEWETISVGMDGYNKPGSWASKILVQDLSGGPPNSREFHIQCDIQCDKLSCQLPAGSVRHSSDRESMPYQFPTR
jgi:hypothetical protein